ncbi:MAG TPA: hypothetical protein PKJ56_11680, partial [Promineifilum sp.]|nr:hypothetical protein [Promineifilum sp.]
MNQTGRFFPKMMKRAVAPLALVAAGWMVFLIVGGLWAAEEPSGQTVRVYLPIWFVDADIEVTATSTAS